MAISLRLLGEITVRDESGETLSLPTRKTLALLSYLAVNADRPQSRDRLMALLWSDRDDRQARQSLNHALMSIRKLNKSSGAALLHSNGEQVTLRSEALTIDVVQFRALLADQPVEAVALHYGPFLDDLLVPAPGFEEWLGTTRSEFHDLACDALERGINTAANNHDDSAAIEAARRLVRLDPIRESGHQHLIRLLYEHGDRASALRQYHDCMKVLRKELAVEPSLTTKALYETVLRDEPVQPTMPACAQKPANIESTAAEVLTRKPERAMRRFVTVAVAIALFIGLATVGLHQMPWSGTDATMTGERTRLVLPENRSVAVPPFVNRNGDPEQDYFSDGVTEDIIARLSKLPGMSVASRTASFTFKARPLNLPQVGQALAVHYVLDGKMERNGQRLHITTQLVEAGTGEILWTADYDRMFRDIFSVQDDIARKVAVTLGVKAAVAEAFLAASRATYNVDAYDHFLHGVNIVRNARTKNAYAQARAQFGKAIALDPLYAQAIAWFGYMRSVEENVGKLTAEITRKLASESEQKQAAEMALKKAVETARQQAIETARNIAEAFVQKYAGEIARKQAREIARKKAAEIARQTETIARTKAEEILQKQAARLVQLRMAETELRGLFGLKEGERFPALAPMAPVAPKNFASANERDAWYSEAKRAVTRRYNRFLAPQRLERVTFTCGRKANRPPNDFCRHIMGQLRVLQINKTQAFALLKREYNKKQVIPTKLTTATQPVEDGKSEWRDSQLEKQRDRKSDIRHPRQEITRYWNGRIIAVKNAGLYSDCAFSASIPTYDRDNVENCFKRSEKIATLTAMRDAGIKPPSVNGDTAAAALPPGWKIDYENDRKAIESAIGDYYFAHGYLGDPPLANAQQGISSVDIKSIEPVKIEGNRITVAAQYTTVKLYSHDIFSLSSNFTLRKKDNVYRVITHNPKNGST